MKVSDLMRSNVLTVGPDTPLHKVNEMLHHFHSDYVVVTEDKKVLGILTYSDLFRQLLPHYDEVMRDESYWLDPNAIEQKASILKNKPVYEVMTKKIISVTPSTSAVHAGGLMIAKKVKQLPVIENDELVGVISYRDLTWGFLLKPKYGD